MKITSDNVFDFIIDRQKEAGKKYVASNDIVSAMGIPYLGMLFITYGLVRIAEAMEKQNEKEKDLPKTNSTEKV